MKIQKLIIFVAAILLIVSAPQALHAYAGVVTVDEIVVDAGDKGILEVRLINNDTPISGIVIPLHKTAGDVTIDSISFVGYMASADFYGSVKPIGSIEDTFEISILPVFGVTPTPTITATEGLLATIHFSVSPGALDDYIPIDTFYTIDSLPLPGGGFTTIVKQINASDPSGLITYLPEFVSGSITIGNYTDVDDDYFDKGLPTDFSLEQNYPNPFNPSTVIKFALPTVSQVRVEVFNILGQSVDVLVDQRLSAGIHEVTYEADKNPSGVYFYRLTYNEGVETRKMTLLK